jgi:hypothetical protein
MMKQIITKQIEQSKLVNQHLNFSADDSTKLRGSRRDVLFINEANNVTFEAFLN